MGTFKKLMGVSDAQAGLGRTAWGAHKMASSFQIIDKFQLKQGCLTRMEKNVFLSSLTWNQKFVSPSGTKVDKSHSAREPATSTSHRGAHTTSQGITWAHHGAACRSASGP